METTADQVIHKRLKQIDKSNRQEHQQKDRIYSGLCRLELRNGIIAKPRLSWYRVIQARCAPTIKLTVHVNSTTSNSDLRWDCPTN